MSKKKVSQLVVMPMSPEPMACRRKVARLAGGPTIGGQVELLRGMVPGLLEEVEYSDEDIEDRGDDSNSRATTRPPSQPWRPSWTSPRSPPAWPPSPWIAPGWTGSTSGAG